MPTYDYECSRCSHLFELRQGFDAPSEAPCPVCQGMAKRRFHSVAVIFKGSGWYTTDYARKNTLPADQKRDGTGDSPKQEPVTKEEPKTKEP